jgi:hypothetical protein
MKIISDEQKYDDNLGMSYREVIGDHEGQRVQVHVDEYGYSAKVGDRVVSRQDEAGLIKFFLFLFGRR